jgi:hypothetical protein
VSEKRFLIEFVGGDVDGRTFDSASADPVERQIVQSLLFMTDNGTVDKAFHGVSMLANEALRRGEVEFSNLNFGHSGKTNKYTVAERLEHGDEVLIRMKYSVKEPT